jgi:hypothetical protein
MQQGRVECCRALKSSNRRLLLLLLPLPQVVSGQPGGAAALGGPDGPKLPGGMFGDEGAANGADGLGGNDPFGGPGVGGLRPGFGGAGAGAAGRCWPLLLAGARAPAPAHPCGRAHHLTRAPCLPAPRPWTAGFGNTAQQDSRASNEPADLSAAAAALARPQDQRGARGPASTPSQGAPAVDSSMAAHLSTEGALSLLRAPLLLSCLPSAGLLHLGLAPAALAPAPPRRAAP